MDGPHMLKCEPLKQNKKMDETKEKNGWIQTFNAPRCVKNDSCYQEKAQVPKLMSILIETKSVTHHMEYYVL